MSLTLPQLTATDIDASIALLDDNVRTGVLIDMNNVDYEMTYAEATAANKVIINVGASKTLSIPTSANSDVGLFGVINLTAAANNLTVEYTDGGASAVFIAGKQAPALFGTEAIGVYNLCDVCAIIANQQSNGVDTTDTISNVVDKAQAGKLIIFNSTAGAQTWTIDETAAGLYPDNMVFHATVPAGCDGITITGQAGVTINGTLAGSKALAAGASCKFWKDGSTDSWTTT